MERAIALVQPRVLLLAGGASAKHMLRRNEGILSLRGRWAEWTPEAGGEAIPALPILHPGLPAATTGRKGARVAGCPDASVKA